MEIANKTSKLVSTQKQNEGKVAPKKRKPLNNTEAEGYKASPEKTHQNWANNQDPNQIYQNLPEPEKGMLDLLGIDTLGESELVHTQKQNEGKVAPKKRKAPNNTEVEEYKASRETANQNWRNNQDPLQTNQNLPEPQKGRLDWIEIDTLGESDFDKFKSSYQITKNVGLHKTYTCPQQGTKILACDEKACKFQLKITFGEGGITAQSSGYHNHDTSKPNKKVLKAFYNESVDFMTNEEILTYLRDRKVPEDELPTNKALTNARYYKKPKSPPQENATKGLVSKVLSFLPGSSKKSKKYQRDQNEDGVKTSFGVPRSKNDNVRNQEISEIEKHKENKIAAIGATEAKNDDLPSQVIEETENEKQMKKLGQVEKAAFGIPRRTDTSFGNILSRKSVTQEYKRDKQLGEGSYGIVYLVTHLKTNKKYAMKQISKDKVKDDLRYIQQEKEVLEFVNSDFIVKLIDEFEDSDNFYFIMEFIDGIEFYEMITLLRTDKFAKDRLTPSDIRFYIASIILALEYLHSNLIVHRDLKPENIMINEKGYLQLIDMGMAIFLPNKDHKVNDPVGTLQYMAPEVLEGHHYGLAADIWSIGVCLFELFFGRVPYQPASAVYRNRVEQKELRRQQRQLIQDSPKYPSNFNDSNAKSLINKLLNTDKDARSKISFSELKTDPWFDGFEWDQLIARKKEPPFYPKKK